MFYKESIPDTHIELPPNMMIGKQAEICFETYLNRSSNYDLLSANLQIQGKTETLGEMDYLVKNLKTGNITHIELACKFYLFDKDIHASKEKKWIGPNRKDSLFEKLEKVKSRQFPLLRKKETVETLQELNLPIPTVQELCVKAFLFIPKTMSVSDFDIEYQKCIVGQWIRFDDFDDLDSTARYAMPPKTQWLLPVNQLSQWYSFQEIKQEIKEQHKDGRSPLIYRQTDQSITRFFVVGW